MQVTACSPMRPISGNRFPSDVAAMSATSLSCTFGAPPTALAFATSGDPDDATRLNACIASEVCVSGRLQCCEAPSRFQNFRSELRPARCAPPRDERNLQQQQQ